MGSAQIGQASLAVAVAVDSSLDSLAGVVTRWGVPGTRSCSAPAPTPAPTFVFLFGGIGYRRSLCDVPYNIDSCRREPIGARARCTGGIHRNGHKSRKFR